MTDAREDLAQSLIRQTLFGLLWKRGLDLLVAGFALLLLSPIILASALAIKLTSPGPLLYVQPRRGRDGRIFNVFKLRTLEHDQCDAPGERDVKPVGSDDARVFPVGRFLRQRGLDELPQLWNVVRGEMSIVGPRPHALPHDDFFLDNIPGYAHRYAVNPGITGWAQVNGSRGKLNSLDDAAERVRYDREYIATMSLLLDIVVMLRTVRVLALGTDAKGASPPDAATRRSSPTSALHNEEHPAGHRAARSDQLQSFREGRRDAIHAGVGLLDQGVTALGSLIPIVLLGRMAGATDLGIFSLAVSAALLASIVSQCLFLSGYPIFRAQTPSEATSHTFYAVLFGLGTQAVVLALCLGALPWIPNTVAVDGFDILAATTFVLATTLRSYLRTLSLIRRDMPTILALDSLALLILLALLVLLATAGVVSVWNVCIALAVANAAFALVWGGTYSRDITVRFSGVGDYLIRSVDFGRWALLGVGAGSMHYFLMPWLLAFVRGTETVAIYAAASTVVGLANHGFIGLMRGVEARTAEAFHQGGIGALQDALKRTMWIVLPVLAVVVAAIWIAADFFGELILPGHAQETGMVARILSLALLLGTARVLAGNALWAMSLPRATVPADLLRGVVTIGAGIIGAYFAGAVGCALGVLLGDALSSLVVVARYMTEKHRRAA
jgi:lipopolysaccharide/colanic/teichoic acid biosynthesis glycosyltransferase/O-antigen/teichoic acid export membrane protein